jgi:hypothetical protein
MALAPAAVVLATATPEALAAPAAVDQYTEQPPAGPGGSQGSIDTSGQNDSQATQRNASPADRGSSGGVDEHSAPATSEPVAPVTSETGGGGSPDLARPQRGAEQPAEPRSGPPHRAVAALAPSDDHERLPLLGYPSTVFVSLVAALLIAALAVRFGIVAYRRRAAMAPHTE